MQLTKVTIRQVGYYGQPDRTFAGWLVGVSTKGKTITVRTRLGDLKLRPSKYQNGQWVSYTGSGNFKRVLYALDDYFLLRQPSDAGVLE